MCICVCVSVRDDFKVAEHGHIAIQLYRRVDIPQGYVFEKHICYFVLNILLEIFCFKYFALNIFWEIILGKYFWGNISWEISFGKYFLGIFFLF